MSESVLMVEEGCQPENNEILPDLIAEYDKQAPTPIEIKEKDVALSAIQQSQKVRTSDEEDKHLSLNDDPITDYFNRITKYPLLTAEQEAAFAKQIEAGAFAYKKLHSQEELSDTEISELKTIVDQGYRAFNTMEVSNLRF